MSLRVGGNFLQVKLALTDAELTSVLGARDLLARADLASSDEKSTGEIASAVRSAAKSGAGASAGAAPRSADIVAHFSTEHDTLTVTGLVNRRHPVQFRLKPRTKSYRNFLRFFLKELRSVSTAVTNMPVVPISGGIDAPNSSASGVSSTAPKLDPTVTKLAAYIEDKLRQLALDTQAVADDLGDIVEVFREDLVPTKKSKRSQFTKMASLPQPTKANGSGNIALPDESKFSQPQNRGPQPRIVVSNRLADQHSFRLVDADASGFGHISGFLSLEVEEIPASSAAPASEDEKALLRATFGLSSAPEVSVDKAEAKLLFRVSFDPSLQDKIKFGVHWGPYQATDSGWFSEEVQDQEITFIDDGQAVIRKTVVADSVGECGAAIYAVLSGSSERVWGGRPALDDARFTFSIDQDAILRECRRQEVIERASLEARVLRGLPSFEQFVRAIHQIQREGSVRGVGRFLFQATRHDDGLRKLISDYYQEAVMALGEGRRGVSEARLKVVVDALQNIGIGEVVFVAPEGPQAIAGGLAQVVVGLSSALGRLGVSATVITPLYAEAQGNKHPAADDYLEKGMVINGQLVPLVEVGEVKIPFGPTFRSGTKEIHTSAMIAVAKVYKAEHEGVRVFFLHHSQLADRLYPASDSKEDLRKSIFLSRGALEILRDSRFGVEPHIVVTNDWLTALVPVLLKTDARYSQDPRFQQVDSVHVLHNCGRDYQGRLFVNSFGEDLWPMLRLSGEHFFGLSDPTDINYLNLTAGAVTHVGRALLAVSRPYAQQLLSEEGGEGLQERFRASADKIFGISNGIDLGALRRVFWKLGEDARSALQLEPLSPSRFNNARLAKRLPIYKAATKQLVQRVQGLSEDPDAVLISMVGRLTEQKGIQLLAGMAEGERFSVLESILRRYPKVQFLIGGPPNRGDKAMVLLADVVGDLVRNYPGRIQAVFSFIPHQQALEITQASDFFLMPSRYEPGGITQLEALACGTPLIARKVGGIAATLIDYSEEQQRGNSFLFEEFSPRALRDVMCRAIETFEHPKKKKWLVREAALAENDWGHRAPKYITVLQHVAGVLLPSNPYPHLNGRSHLLASIRP